MGFFAEAKIEFLGVTLIGVTAEVPSKPLVEQEADVEVEVVLIKRRRVDTKTLDDALVDK